MKDDNNKTINIRDFYNHETRITLLERTIEQINTSLIEIKKEIKEGFFKIDFEIKEIRFESKSQFRWIMGFIFGLYSAIIGGLITLVFKLWH